MATAVEYVCRRCGDRRLPPPHDWAGEGDIMRGASEPHPGGLGPCGDLHNWIVREEETMDRVVVWGRGAAASQIIRGGEPTELARSLACQYGFKVGDDPEAWAVEVEAPVADVDAATRHDPAVLGWEPVVAAPEPAVRAVAARAVSAVGRPARITYRVGTVTETVDAVIVDVQLGPRGLRLTAWEPRHPIERRFRLDRVIGVEPLT